MFIPYLVLSLALIIVRVMCAREHEKEKFIKL